MLKWLLVAWIFVPGGCWIVTCAIVRHWQRRSSYQRKLMARRHTDFEQLSEDTPRLVFFSEPWLN